MDENDGKYGKSLAPWLNGIAKCSESLQSRGSCICLSLEVRHNVGFQKITDNTKETRANALFPFPLHFSCLITEF